MNSTSSRETPIKAVCGTKELRLQIKKRIGITSMVLETIKLKSGISFTVVEEN